MRPQDIEEGATYQNAGGGLARQVFGIYHHEPEPRVLFLHVNGPRKGEHGACTLQAFATWAHVQVGVEQTTLHALGGSPP